MGKLRIRHLLVAGGAGFLGSAFVRDRLRADPEILITVLDTLRRPGAGADLDDLSVTHGAESYALVKSAGTPSCEYAPTSGWRSASK